jgi:hypothetical protein
LFKSVTIEKIVARYSRELENIIKDSGGREIDGRKAEQKRRIKRGAG